MPAPPKKTANESEPRRSTRSHAKNAETPSPPSKETATAKTPLKRKKPNKAMERASKRVHTNIQAGVPVEDRNHDEAPGKITGPTEQGTHQPVSVVKASVRKAPPRPELSLYSGDEGDGGCVNNDDESHAGSDEGVTDFPTAVDLINEYPTPVETVTSDQNNGMDNGTDDVVEPRLTSGKRATRILDEVPTLSINSRGNDAPMVPAQFATAQLVYPSLQNTALPPTLNGISSPKLGVVPPVWPAITDLVVGRDGRYQQSDQTPEIQACLKAAVRRANGNLVFSDGFPDTQCKAQWLGDALVTELSERRKTSITVAAVDERARHDQRYLNQLLHMISGRWSTFRQGVIDATRALVTSPESSYGVHVPDDLDQAQIAQNLLSNDAYHFAKTAAGAIDTAAPYQHQEVFAALAHYFKGREAVGVIYEERVPNGIHGAQIPDAMVALTATAIQVALEEIVAGRPSAFSEKGCREKYRNHFNTLQIIKASTDGTRKHARMMSNIYQGMINHLKNGRPTPSPANVTMVDLGRMAV